MSLRQAITTAIESVAEYHRLHAPAPDLRGSVNLERLKKLCKAENVPNHHLKYSFTLLEPDLVLIVPNQRLTFLLGADYAQALDNASVIDFSIQSFSETFRSDLNRLLLGVLLRVGSVTRKQMIEQTGVVASSIDKSLKALVSSGYVGYRLENNHRVYDLNHSAFQQVSDLTGEIARNVS